MRSFFYVSPKCETKSIDAKSISRPFWIAVAIVACSILGLYVWIASIEWFVSDDFAFLFYVQQPWSWTKVFFPLEKPFWWTYRPLGMDSYFYAAFPLVGWNAQGFFAITIFTHTLTAATVFRLGRQLGFDVRSALFASLIAVSRFPSITNLTLACCFHYVSALFFLVLSLSLFIDYVRGIKRGFLIGACVSFLLGLLCNEFVMSLPFLLVLIALYEEPFFFSRSALIRIGARVMPFFIIAAMFAFYRYGVLNYSKPPYFYQFILGRHIFGNAKVNLFYLFGSDTAFYLALSVWVAMMAMVGFAKQKPKKIGSTLLRRHMITVPWLVGMSAVLGALPFPQQRFAMTLQIPAALLFATWLDALFDIYRTQYQRILETAIIVILVVLLPWSKVAARAELPKGVWMRNFQRTVLETYPDLPDYTVVSVLFGGCGLADKRVADEVNLLGYGPAVVQSRYPDKHINIRYQDIIGSEPPDILCYRCRYFKLLPSREIRALSLKQTLEKIRTAKPFCE